ncbi:MAG: NAD-dependent deacylase [Deltaproteobacteria bacterium]|nr:NAD-dependent deacylase [Deltaproteobacteria bacterium]
MDLILESLFGKWYFHQKGLKVNPHEILRRAKVSTGLDERGALEKRAAEDILNSQKAIALTGAGISVESGVPDFRSAGGLWSKYDPEEYAHISAFRSNPEKVWRMLKEMIELVMGVEPNPAHVALAELEQMGLLSSVITQNVDGLHQRAGSKEVIEFHGSNQWLVCLECGHRRETASLSLEDIPPRCPECGFILKPDVVFFGEPIPWEAQTKAFEEARTCDLVLVIGTSAVVYPAGGIPIVAKRNGAKLVEINMEPTALTGSVSDYLLQGPAGKILPKIVEEIREKIS